MKRSMWMSLCATVWLLAACAAPVPTGPAAPVTRTFANTAPIWIAASGASVGAADPYPSAIIVSDMPASATKVTVSLRALTHTRPGDLDVLLVGPTGAHALLLSDAGQDVDAARVTLVFDAAADAEVPEAGPLVSGTVLPTAFMAGDTFPAPAPGGPYEPDLTVFNGTDPNGSWNLFVYDDSTGDSGVIDVGWSLTITSN